MSIIWQKGSSYTYKYSSPDYPVLDDDWTGKMDIYSQYPNVLTATVQMVRSGNDMILSVSLEDVSALQDGMYTAVSSITNEITGESVGLLAYVTVAGVSLLVDKTSITMTILKIDGTPAGKETRTLTNTVDGAVITLGWDGVQVTASHPVADEISGAIIGTETISTKTNAAGYAQLAVIKGSTVTVSCPSFGKTVEVNTTGLDTIDLSTHF